jgi:hypothetical protein
MQKMMTMILTALMFTAITGVCAPPLTIPQVEKKDSICFALYTVENGILKMTAQLYPLADDDSRSIRLEIEKDGKWETVAESTIRENAYGLKDGAKAWNVLFRVENWDNSKDFNYRVVALEGVAVYKGIIRKDPVDKNEIVVAAFTGNSNRDRRLKPDIIRNIKAINPDLLFFSGDQSYDHRQHLAAWLLFGRQFGEIIKDRPTISIPDDHDVGQGNLWGASGKKSTGAGGCADGGYLLPVSYVKEVEFAQTSNLPDPFDPTPVLRGIGVHYTSLNVGGIDFAIIEDRKFKTGPLGLVETPGHKRPDLINDENYDRKSIDHPDAKLLGKRQLKFLEEWGEDWSGTDMKCVLSPTIFAQGCHKTGPWRVTADLDSNGWPQSGRNKALRVIRKSFAFMLAGDQHLATVIQHGVDDWHDAGFSFCVPSIVNYWPRSWVPLKKGLNPTSSLLEYTGDFPDGFGNKISMYAYANPQGKTGKIGTAENPFLGGAAGFGVVRFNKKDRSITMECRPRNVDLTKANAPQYPGWPITIKQSDNYGRKAVAWLPTLKISGQKNPVVQIIDESNGEVVYTIRIKGNSFRPKVFVKGLYTIKVGEGSSIKTIKGVSSIATDKKQVLKINLK